MSKKQSYSFDSRYRTGNIPAPALHVLLERLTKDWIARWKQGVEDLPPRHPSFLVAYHKGFQVKNRVIAISPRGKALSMLNSQFAKKPKNPV